MTNARAVVTVAPRALEVREFPVQDPEPGAVVIRMRLSGICGTDKHTFRGESKQYAGTDHERDIEYPLICGHENVGTVVATGGEVRDSEGRVLLPGDRIVPGANVACGRCFYCRNDLPYYLCRDLDDYGNSLGCARPPYLMGGWSEYMYLLPGSRLFRVPDALPDEVAVLTEVMAVTHGVEKALAVLGLYNVDPVGVSVAVLGVGPLGLCHLLKARMLGAGTVIATDLLPGRLERAAAFGVDLALDASATDLRQRKEAVLDATDGRGADVVLDCSGVPATFVEALEVVRPGGVVVEAGTFVDMGPVGINPNSAVCTRNVSILGIGGEIATGYAPSMRLLVANMDRYDLRSIVSHRYALEEAPEAMAMAQSGASMQVAFDPTLRRDALRADGGGVSL
jgi:threonine dehydrogenase-like Zn-dependent dehydrogenase